MNKKKTIILSLAVIWVFIFVSYTLSNPDNLVIKPNQQDLNFQQASHIVTGYLNTTKGVVGSTMPKLP